MKTYVSIHDIGLVNAVAPGSLGAPLILQLIGHDGTRLGDITLFLGDTVVADNMANGINSAMDHKCEKDSAHEAAHNAAAVYDYRGSER